MPVAFTGRPSIRTGEKRDRRAAVSADCRSSGCPLTARADVTLPLSSIVTWTVTGPEARTARAGAGYTGVARFNARPFSEPAFTGPVGRGVGVSAGEFTGGRVFVFGDGVASSSGVAVGLGEGLGDGEGFGVGVGVGVARFALMFGSTFALKLKLLSMIDVFTFVSTLPISEFAFEFAAESPRMNHSSTAPAPITASVPSTVRNTTFHVFAGLA